MISDTLFDRSTLRWLNAGLEDTLLQARRALEDYVEGAGGSESLAACVDQLHRLEATLSVAQVYGAAMLAGEMEALGRALADGRVPPSDRAAEVLMIGLLQLPIYLEKVEGGAPDIPLGLLPLMNDLRSVRGAEAASEINLFAPKLDKLIAAEPVEPEAAGSTLGEFVRGARNGLLRGMLAWFQGAHPVDGVQQVREFVARLAARARTARMHRLLDAVEAMLVVVRDDQAEADADIKRLFGQLDRFLKRVQKQGEQAAVEDFPIALLKGFLYQVARSDSADPTVQSVRRWADLANSFPADLDHEQDLSALAGTERELLQAVNEALGQDLRSAKDTLDLYIRGDRGDAERLQPLLGPLQRIADTLGMVGQGELRTRLLGRVEQVERSVESLTDAALMAIASDILHVESVLAGLAAPPQAGSGSLDEESLLTDSELSTYVGAALDEVFVELGKVKDILGAFLGALDDSELLSAVPARLHSVAGAIKMLDLPGAGILLQRLAGLVEELNEGRRPALVDDQPEALADVLTGVEYYLEAVREHRPNRDEILGVAEQAARRLGIGPEQLGTAEPAEGSKQVEVDTGIPPTTLAQALAATESLLESAELEPAGEAESAETPVAAGSPVEPTPESEPEPATPDAVEDIPASQSEPPAAAEITGAPAESESLIEPSYEPEPEAREEIAALPSEPAEEVEIDEAPVEAEWLPEPPAESEPAPLEEAQPEPAAAATLEIGVDVDEEILEIFFEEAGEELERIQQSYPVWRQRPADTDSLRTLRRSFHTLKGSGRLVGAFTLGEFAWSIENLLNRVLDGGVPAGEPLVGLLDETCAALPLLIEAQRRGTPLALDLGALSSRADALARGEAVEPDAGPGGPEPEITAVPEIPTEAPAEFETEPETGVGALPAPEASEAAEPAEPVEFAAAGPEPGGRSEAGPAEVEAASEPEPHEAPTEPIPPLAEETEQPVAGEVPFESEAATEAPEPEPAAAEPEAGPPIEEVAEAEDALEAPSLEAAFEEGVEERVEEVADQEAGEGLQTQMPAGAEPMPPAAEQEPAGAESGPEPVPEPPREPEPGVTGEAVEPPSVEEVLPEFVPPAPGDFDIAASAEEVFDDDTVDVDSTLLGIFCAEGREHLDVLAAFIDRASREPAPVDAELQRAIHTLRGSAHTAGVTQIASLCGGYDHLLALLSAEGRRSDPRVLELLETGHQVLAEMLEAVDQGRDAIPQGEDLLREVNAFNASLEQKAEEHLGYSAQEDSELLEIFVEESKELLEQIEHDFAVWQERPQDRSALAGLQRSLHTLKGGARLTGVTPVGDLSHVLESLFERVLNAELAAEPALISRVRRAVDHVAMAVESLRDGKPLPELSGVIERLQALVTGELSAADADSDLALIALAGEPDGAAAEPAPEEPPAGAAAAPPSAETDESGIDEAEAGQEAPSQPEPLPAPPAGGGSRILQFPGGAPLPSRVATTQAPPTPEPEAESEAAPVERVRVRSDLLDNMVNHAGEVGIHRARLEQQNSLLGFNLQELNQTISRLRDQLRKLEFETETQILSRHERADEMELDADFDPLEMDRYSMIQQLSRALSETVNDLTNLGTTLGDLKRDTDTLLGQQARVSNDLQDSLLRSRMIPFSSRLARLQRVVRQTADSLNRPAELVVYGGQGEVDRSILDRMMGPLEHLLRNAVAHGIESREQRRAAGKPERGVINLALSREGPDVVLAVGDDGAGLNREAIRDKAVQRGLLAPEVRLDDDILYQLILEHGFSTAESVNQIAGRGVGLDAVLREVKQLGGSLEVSSAPNSGARFTIRLPFTLALTEALLVSAGEEVYALPHTGIESVVRISRDELTDFYEGRRESFEYVGVEYQVRYLGTLLETGLPSVPKGQKWFPLMLARAGDHRVAIHVDSLLGNRQIVIKSIGPQLSTVRWFTGGTILADGRVALILDMGALLRADARTARPLRAVQPAEAPQAVSVMVVDDSITVRKVTSRLLERHDMQVVTAKDGVDAVTLLQEHRPDVMLLDVEMPRMDGYELARHMRNSKELSQIPIIMITSRSGEKHREYARQLGVEHYLGKPYQESELLDNIFKVLGGPGAS